MVFIRKPEEVEKIRKAAQIVKAALDEVENAIRPGISTWDLNLIAESVTLKLGAKPAFKGYRGFPACLCTSVNDEVVHGIPRKERILKEGDLIGIDYGASLEGYFGDSARTVPVGFRPEGRLAELVNSTKEALDVGIRAAKSGGFVSDIGKAIEDVIRPRGFGIVRDYVGHGIGRQPHEDPPIPHYKTKERGAALRVGMVICIEPMINMGTHEVYLAEDRWTVITADHQLSAHFEHTLVVTERGGEVLSA